MINIYLCSIDRKNKILNDKAGSAGCLVCWQCMCGQPGYRWSLAPGAPVAGIPPPSNTKDYSGTRGTSSGDTTS